MWRKLMLSIFNDNSRNSFHRITYSNFWTTQQAKDIWFSKFMVHHQLITKHSPRINFHSVLGPVENLSKRKKGVHIFYSGENMQADRFAAYRRIVEEQPYDLSIGFEETDGSNSMRFPLWILTLFDPTLDEKGIKDRVKQLSERPFDNRNGFCSLVASHDWNGIRGQIIDELGDIGNIASGGKFRNNTNELNQKFNNNKQDFIQQYKFNICPENSNAPGYVTEKVFQAIDAGCIPIYWGSDNCPEPEILSQDAIIRWNYPGDNSRNRELIRKICSDEKEYRRFMAQPKLLPGAEDVIWEYFEQLKREFEKSFL